MTMAHQRSRAAINKGFSLSELLIVTAIVGIFAGLAINIGIRQWQRERVNGMAVQLAGWIETVRRASLRGTSCAITVASGDVSANDVVAQTSDDDDVAGDNNCLDSNPLRVNANSNMAFSLTSSPEGAFGYTPRGTFWSTSSPVVITLTLSSGGPSRCVQISGLLGVVEVGKSSGGSCSTGSRF
jgi:prepilin-type N-terminal cleavage/methylation domain-containing protein